MAMLTPAMPRGPIIDPLHTIISAMVVIGSLNKYGP